MLCLCSKTHFDCKPFCKSRGYQVLCHHIVSQSAWSHLLPCCFMYCYILQILGYLLHCLWLCDLLHVALRYGLLFQGFFASAFVYSCATVHAINIYKYERKYIETALAFPAKLCVIIIVIHYRPLLGDIVIVNNVVLWRALSASSKLFFIHLHNLYLPHRFHCLQGWMPIVALISLDAHRDCYRIRVSHWIVNIIIAMVLLIWSIRCRRLFREINIGVAWSILRFACSLLPFFTTVLACTLPHFQIFFLLLPIFVLRLSLPCTSTRWRDVRKQS